MDGLVMIESFLANTAYRGGPELEPTRDLRLTDAVALSSRTEPTFHGEYGQQTGHGSPEGRR